MELRLENDETWKTMEATEKALNDMITIRNYDVTTFFQEENPPPKSPHEAAKQRGEWLEMEAYYLAVSLSSLLYIRNHMYILISRIKIKIMEDF